MRFLQFLPHRWWSPRAWRVWGSYLHWRLETYGVYYPAGKFNKKVFLKMLKQFPSYRAWLSDFSKLRKKTYLTRN
jgi:hypothetical protein